MNMTPVTSSNISSIGYEEDTLYVTFHSGATYAYFNVPAHVYQELMAAPSHGRYLSAYVKGTYAYKKLG